MPLTPNTVRDEEQQELSLLMGIQNGRAIFEHQFGILLQK
jgi:hypothetical protein